MSGQSKQKQNIQKEINVVGDPVKKRPQRMCVACRRTNDKDCLLRLVQGADGRMLLDTTGTQNGRGAYLCVRLACLETALKRRSLERALRLTALHPDDSVMLRQVLQQRQGTDS